MATVTLKSVYKIYEGGVQAVSDFNLDIDDKEFIVLVGPSGLWKNNHTAYGSGSRRNIRRRNLHRRQTYERCSTEGPRYSDGFPKLCSLSAHDSL